MPRIALVTLSLISFAVSSLVADDPLRLEVQLDRGLYRSLTENTVYLKASIKTGGPSDTAQRPTLNVALAVDRSGSMEGPKLANTKAAISDALAQLSSTDLFSLVAYGSHIDTPIESQPVDQIVSPAPLIESLSAKGGTALFDALNQAAAQIRRHQRPDTVNRIILISDGQANKGPREPEDFAALAARFAQEGISIAAIGLGEDFHEETLYQLASAAGGSLRNARNPDDLAQAIYQEIGLLNQVIAKDAFLEIVFDGQTRIEETLGRAGQIDRQTVRFSFDYLYAHQELFVIAQAKLAASQATDMRPRIASVKLEYTPLSNPDSRSTLEANATARFTDDSRSSYDSIDPSVFHSICSMEAADTIREALAFFDQGKPDRALKELRNTARDIRVANNEIEEPRIYEILAELNRTIDALESRGLDAIDRKALTSTLYNRTHRGAPAADQ